MGEIAARGADIVIVTDDNPRSEDAAEIRAMVMKGAPDATEIAGRRDADARLLQGPLRVAEVACWARTWVGMASTPSQVCGAPLRTPAARGRPGGSFRLVLTSRGWGVAS
mgnify:CR=1 FL=1